MEPAKTTNTPSTRRRPIRHLLPMPDGSEVEQAILPGVLGDLNSEKLDTTQERKVLFDLAKASHIGDTYQFKRFMKLNLLSIFHYQHILVKLNERIETNNGITSSEELESLQTFLQQYSKLRLV